MVTLIVWLGGKVLQAKVHWLGAHARLEWAAKQPEFGGYLWT